MPDPDAPGCNCDMPGCGAPGEYRAPKSRSHLTEYWWFCLEHVRAYNAAWDFYKGMSPGEIEAQLRADTAWQRPSWPLGHLGGRIDEHIERSAVESRKKRAGRGARVQRARRRSWYAPSTRRSAAMSSRAQKGSAPARHSCSSHVWDAPVSKSFWRCWV